ncbi:MAG: hypothetical protein JOZ03_03960 [Gammaproteobacteria bacterium]|nr:hypothetical protein [Gammaproteobacteria bacterium]
MNRREVLEWLGVVAYGGVLGARPQLSGADDPESSGTPTAAEKAAGVTPQNFAYAPLNVMRYGAVGDGVTDDRAAIRAAWLVARQQGGGTIVFPNRATYVVGSLDPASPVAIPQQQAGGTIEYHKYQTQLYFQNGSNIAFDFQGSTLKSTATGGGLFMVLDGCKDIRLLGPKISGAQVMSTGVVSLGNIRGGSGYANGTYRSVPLTGGSGGGAVVDVVVSGGAVTSASVSYPGGHYKVGDTVSCSNAPLGNSGSGFSATVASVSGAGPTVAVAAPNGIVCTALTRPTSNITINDLEVSAMYSGLYVVGDPTTANSISHINLTGHTRIRDGDYAVALHNGGDDSVIENLYTFRVNRPFFFYGVQNVRLTCVGDQTNFGFQPVIKAYSRSTRNITVKYSAINQPGQSGAVAKVAIQVQHDPAVISPPPTVQTVSLQYDEANLSAGGNGVEFDYYAGPGGATMQSASDHQLFNDIVISGNSRNTLLTTVALNNPAARCNITVDHFSFAAPRAPHELTANGFAMSRR